MGDLENRNDDEAVDEFNRIYQLWYEGDLDVAMPGGETALDVLDRYVPVLMDLRMRFLDDHHWTGDIVVVSHGAAIRLVAKTLPGSKAASRSNTTWPTPNAVVLTPITDGRWSCVHWGSAAPPFYPAERRRRGFRGRPDGLSAFATDHVAVDHQRVRNQFGPGQSKSVHSECRNE